MICTLYTHTCTQRSVYEYEYHMADVLVPRDRHIDLAEASLLLAAVPEVSVLLLARQMD